jgi:glutamyl-tRNA reductase
MRGSLRSLMPEGAILSTCNRTEIYCATEQPGEVPPALSGWLSHRQGLAAGQLDSHLYVLPNGQPCATPSASPAGSIRWCSANRRSSAR